MAHPGGRPTKYKKSYCKDVIDYFHTGNKDYYPSIAGYAARIGVSKFTIFEWAKTIPEFSNALDKGRAIGEDLLIRGTMSGSFNPNFAKFVGQNFFGMAEKVESKNEHNFPTGIKVSFVGPDEKGN